MLVEQESWPIAVQGCSPSSEHIRALERDTHAHILTYAHVHAQNPLAHTSLSRFSLHASVRFRAYSVELRDKTGKVVAGEIGYSIGAVYTSLTGFWDTTRAPKPSQEDSADHHHQQQKQRRRRRRQSSEVDADEYFDENVRARENETLPQDQQMVDDDGGAKGQYVYNSAGAIQLVGLSKLLQRCGFAFWNLGHPYKPQYKDPTRSMTYKKEMGAHTEDRPEYLQRWIAARGVPGVEIVCNQPFCVRDYI